MDRVYVMQLVHSLQVGGMSRRDFLARATAALGSVSAASLLLGACASGATPASPVVEATPAGEPPSGGGDLITETVSYPDADGETLTGYLARPDGEGTRPGVVIIQEWWGLNEHIRDVTRRFAQAGFVALAPDLYHGAVVTEPNEARKLVMELDMAEAVREIRAAIAFLLARDDVAGPKAAIVGFCMGGRLALQTARADETLGATVVFYGSPLTPAEAQEVRAPVLGLYGAQDQGIPVAAVRAMGDALTAAGVENHMEVYEGAGHAFFNDTRASYHAEAAADAWGRAVGWLREKLAG